MARKKKAAIAAKKRRLLAKKAKLKVNHLLNQVICTDLQKEDAEQNNAGIKMATIIKRPGQKRLKKRLIRSIKANYKFSDVSDIFGALEELKNPRDPDEDAEKLVVHLKDKTVPGLAHKTRLRNLLRKCVKENFKLSQLYAIFNKVIYKNLQKKKIGPPEKQFKSSDDFVMDWGGGGELRDAFEDGRGRFNWNSEGFEDPAGFEGGIGGFDRSRGRSEGGQRGLDRNRGGFEGSRGGFDRNRGGFEGGQGGFNRSRGGLEGGQGGFDKNSGGFEGGRGGFDWNRGGFEGGQGGFDRSRGGFEGGQGGFDRSRGRFEGGQRGFDRSRGGFEGGQRGFDRNRGGFEGGQRGFDRSRGGFGGGQRGFDRIRGGFEGGQEGIGRGARQQSDQDRYGGGMDFISSNHRASYLGNNNNSRDWYSGSCFEQEKSAESHGSEFRNKPGYHCEYSSGREGSSYCGGSQRVLEAQEKTSYSSYTPQIKMKQPNNASAYGYSRYTPQVKVDLANNSAQYGYNSYSSNIQICTSYVPPSQPTQGYQTVQHAYGYNQ